jgi:endonuclease VIII
MPEGPEIKRAADQLKRALIAQTALSVTVAPDRFAHLQGAARRFKNTLIVSLEPRGKALLTGFSNGVTIYTHNQLYGEWALFSRADHATRHTPPATHLQTRLVIETAQHWAVLYSASEIEFWPTDKVEQHPYLAKLGVELLARETRINNVLAHIRQPRFAKRSLAALLLDQGFLAGVGNYLRSEILFVARLPADSRIVDLTDAQVRALAHAALTLTRQSYRTNGVTNDTKLAATLRAQGWPFARYRHWVFDREEESCHVCATRITRVDASGRGLFLCTRCQKAS